MARLLACVLAALLLVVPPAGADAGGVVTPAPGPNDICPVCGMFVAKFPEWVATVVYRDGHAHHFDGAKDMFKFLADPGRYAPGHRREDIATVAVTDYYAVERIDARQALYVVGSDVLGPMGHELIPLATRADAEEFMKDHKGKAILTFDQVTAEVIRKLDSGGYK
ncbi:MAG: nitrous oxide reductase accessory protein NosL [Pseudomonadota bacterium]